MTDTSKDLQIIDRIEKENRIKIKLFYNENEYNKDRKTKMEFANVLMDQNNNVSAIAIRRCPLVNHKLLTLFKNCTKLDLRDNKLIDITILKELKNLDKLYLSNNNLADVTILKELKNLTTLDLRNNNLADVTILKELKNLTKLELSHNRLTDVTILKELKNLTKLYLSHNKLTDVTILKELKNLTKLALRDNKLTDVTILKELKNLTVLDLGYNKLTDVTILKELKNLTELDLGYSKLTDVAILKELKNLTKLALRDNKLTDVTILKELKNLTVLDLRNNKLTDVTILKELKNLTKLDLSYNKLTDVTMLKELKKLTMLDLGNNDLEVVTILKELKNLTTLDLGFNKLTDVTILSELKNLTRLILRNNKLTDVTILSELKNLTVLNLRSNKLTDVTMIGELKNLTMLYLDYNPITIPPEKVWKGGPATIRNYFKQIEEQGSDFLYEAKIILVGEAGAGKTSLVRKIKDINYPIPNNAEKETIGIHVEVDTFLHPAKPSTTFRANIWDFGGQDIQYTIHQFFLTAGALYLLVLDDRKENTDYDYWFNIIRVLGECSPVIVVLNEVNKLGLPNYDHVVYKTRYPDLHIEKCEVDLAKKDLHLEELIKKIKNDVTLLKGLGSPLPKQWIPIREELEKLTEKNHITYEEFTAICKMHKLTDALDQEFLAKTFHRIGVFLHFSSDANLFNTIFLNHKWVVDSLYTVLKDKGLRDNNGLFEKKKIFELWGNGYTIMEKNQLLLLMQKNNFDLCYKVGDGGSDRFLFPSVMPVEKPLFAQQWQPKESLKFRFQYKFMPRGIITRLIVRLSDYIHTEKKANIVWRSGSVLNKGNALALINEDVNKQGTKVIDIAIEGQEYERRDFLIIIKEELCRIHATFNNLQTDEMIPCICSECIVNKSPNYFGYAELEKYRRNKISTIRCNQSSILEEVDVDKLLEGVEKYKEDDVDEKINYPQQPSNPVEVVKKEIEPRYKIAYHIIGILVGIITIITFIYNTFIKVKKETSSVKPKNKTEQVQKDTIAKKSVEDTLKELPKKK